VQANMIRVSFWLRNVSDTDEANPWIITQFLRSLSPPLSDSAFESDFATTPSALWALWHNSISATPGTGGFRAALPTSINWYYTEVAARLAMTPGDADHVATFTTGSTSSPYVGTRSGTIAQQPLSVVAQKVTTTGSRRQWGRNYLPCLSADIDSDGRVNATNAAPIVTALDALWANTWILNSDYSRSVQNSDGAGRTIASTRLGTYAGVQRRRLR